MLWEAFSEPKQGHILVLGIVTTGLAILLIFSQVPVIWRFLSESLAPSVNLTTLNVDIKWLMTVGMVIVVIGVYDDVHWLVSIIKGTLGMRRSWSILKRTLGSQP